MLAACGPNGDGGDEAGDDQSEPPTEEESEQEGDEEAAAEDEVQVELTTVRLQSFGNFLPTMPMVVAQDQGYYEDEGLVVEENEPIFNAAQIVQAVNQGAAEFGLPGANAPVEVAAAGQDVRVVANAVSPFGVQIILGTETIAQLEAEGITVSSPVDERLAALEGMTIAAPDAGSTTNLMAQAIIRSGGLDPASDVTIQPIGDGGAMIAAVREGAVNGMAGFFDLGANAEVQGFGEIWIDNVHDDVDDGLLIPHLQIIVNPDFADSNPEAVEAFVRAIQRAKDYLEAVTEEELSALKAEYFADMEQAVFERAVELFGEAYTTSIVPTVEQHESVVDLIEGDNPGVADVEFDDVYDTQFAEAATAE